MLSCLKRLKRGDILHYKGDYTLGNSYRTIIFKRYNTVNSELIVEDSYGSKNFDLTRIKVVKIVKAK